MSVVHDLLNRIEEKENTAMPWESPQPSARQGLFVFDLPNEILNDFYDLKEYIRIANLRGRMRVLSLASSVSGEGSSTIATYLAFLMAGGLVKKIEKSIDEAMGEDVDDEVGDEDDVFTAEFKAMSQASDEESEDEAEEPASQEKADGSEQEILLVDANLHQPSLHKFFGLDAEHGLAEILDVGMDWRDVAKPVKDSNLALITAGRTEANPVELLSSDRFYQVVAEWREAYRYVIFDSPPVLSYVDSLSLASVVDGVVLVVRAGYTRWEVAQNAKRKLATAQANLLGVALNRRKIDIPDGLYKPLVK